MAAAVADGGNAGWTPPVSVRTGPRREERHVRTKQLAVGVRAQLLRMGADERAALRIPFRHDPGRDIVTAAFTLDSAFSGTPEPT